MEISKEEQSLPGTNNNIIKIPLALLEEKENNEISNNREKRIIKAKVINDLGFSNKTPFLNKKVKRSNACLSTKSKNITKDTSNESDICLKIFNQFKSTINYKDYPLFIEIQKKVKRNKYSNHSELCSDIRYIFNQYFTTYSFEPEQYCKLLSLCDSYENQYKEYGNKVLMKESKNMIEIKNKLNNLKKELRESNYTYPSDNNHNHHHMKMSNSGNNGLNNSFDKHANKKYKVQLANDIRRLNQEQKKGIATILSKAFMDLNDNKMEIDVNKIPNCQLKELEKYVMKCLKSNSSSVTVNNNNSIQEKINVNININNNFLLQKADSTMNSMNQEIQSEREKNDNYLQNRQAVFSESDSMLSDDSDSDIE